MLLTIAYQAILRLAYATGDLARVDSILEPLADASDRALLRFGTVRCHLCAVTNAIARGELDDVRDLIATARDVGHRFRTHAVDTATASQELLLELELDVLHRRGDVLEAMAAIHPHTQAATIAALARPHDDDAYERLPDMVDRLPRDDSFPAVIALTTLLAADRRDPVLGRRCIDLLDPLGDRILTVGFGSIVLGPACIHTGIANIAVGDLDAAEASLRRAVRLATKSTAWLWAATADLWLAEAMLERRRGDDAAAALSRVAAVEESGRFGETWRIGRQAALLRRAASEGVSPGKLRAQQRHRPGVAHDAG